MSRKIHHLKLIDASGGIEERIIWEVPKSAKCPDGIRYRLAYIPKGSDTPSVLYDNHHPKGHHKHLRHRQFPYRFTDVEQLLEDFGRDVEASK